MSKVLIIIPAYNEEASILRVVRKVQETCPMYDYVVVNDCSTDNTPHLLDENCINHLDLPVNLGIGGCMQTGYLYAEEKHYDYAVQIDGDGQHDPRFIPEGIALLEAQHADGAIGSRFLKKQGFQSSGMRRAGIHWFSTLLRWLCGITIKDVTSGFRIINHRLLNIYTRYYSSDYPEPEALVQGAMCGARFVEFAVEMSERSEGSSSIFGLRSIYYAIKVTLGMIVCRTLSASSRRF